ncbi:hypothetical protein [Alkalicoccobacillus plakortidis]|uniref:YfhD-like protein n=1 Tax=Alkalicoccobacillus plakortidis TaxID=444060 RepID=A0ABT0XRJ5_9BACI|nr:hypothetical protein [Alkalicoccobacillus plakortidis]MCM2677894.1 hypothetical protein [Alkalicoccobacillus plakortidis]
MSFQKRKRTTVRDRPENNAVDEEIRSLSAAIDKEKRRVRGHEFSREGAYDRT